MQSLTDILKSWSKNTDSRAKLQQAYLASALILLLVAGMIGLVNYQFGQQLLLLALVAGAIYIINAVAWALLQSFILIHLDNKASSAVGPEVTDEGIETTVEASAKAKPKPKAKTAKKTEPKK